MSDARHPGQAAFLSAGELDFRTSFSTIASSFSRIASS